MAVASIAWGLLMIAGWLLNTEMDRTVPSNRPIKDPIDDYVSADSCRSCHPGNHASWHASYHRTMTQVATPEAILADMDGLELTDQGVTYRVQKKGAKHFVSTKKQTEPDSAYTEAKEVVLLTGSHNLQICWLATTDGRTLEQFPFAYIVAEKMWAPMAQSFLVPPGPKQVYSKGDWNMACINCHVTQGRAGQVENGIFDSKVSDFGISCESCHSGGKEHIEINRNPLRRFGMHLTDGSDQTIANPAKMKGPEATLVCGQCHSIWLFNNPQEQKVFGQENGKYRPGMSDLDLRWVVQPGSAKDAEKQIALQKEDPDFIHNSYWADGMVRVTGREYNGTTRSPCFKGGDFSCLSCHEMHPKDTDPKNLKAWAVDQMGPEMNGNQACLQCHKDLEKNLSAHTHHPASSAGSSCYNCHMPHTSFGLMRALRSHQITSPTVVESLEIGRPNACNLCHFDQPLAWTAEKLHDWYGHDVPALDVDDQELSAAAKWILKGDAGQRGLVAWAMGWAPAQQASGYDWLYPFLIFELNDPYAAVRFGAWQSLKSLPGFSTFKYDYTLDDAKQKESLIQAYQMWWNNQRDISGKYRWQTILKPTGEFRQETYDRLLNERDNREVYLIE